MWKWGKNRKKSPPAALKVCKKSPHTAFYIYWELSLIKELGYELNLANSKKIEGKNDYSININNKSYIIPKIILNQENKISHTKEVLDGLIFNKHLLVENFITPNRLRYPLFRNMLERYYS